MNFSKRNVVAAFGSMFATLAFAIPATTARAVENASVAQIANSECSATPIFDDDDNYLTCEVWWGDNNNAVDVDVTQVGCATFCDHANECKQSKAAVCFEMQLIPAPKAEISVSE